MLLFGGRARVRANYVQAAAVNRALFWRSEAMTQIKKTSGGTIKKTTTYRAGLLRRLFISSHFLLQTTLLEKIFW